MRAQSVIRCWTTRRYETLCAVLRLPRRFCLIPIGPGVQEIRIPYDKEAYRVIYVARLADCIYVLHAFHKKAKKGIATPKEEIDLASKRYKELVRSLRRS